MGLAVLALYVAFGGLVAYLAGVTGLTETRRLQRDGLTAWALVKRPADDGSARPLLQFATRDGLVMEVFSPSAPAAPIRCWTGGRYWSATTRPTRGRCSSRGGNAAASSSPSSAWERPRC